MELNKEKIEELHKDYVMQTWSLQGKQSMAVKDAEGIYFWDYDGNKYADMSSQLVCSNLGHKNKEITDAIIEQAKKFSFMASAYATDVKSELTEKIIELAGKDFYRKVFYVSGGSTANDNAVKIARMVTGKSKILSSYRSYHGSSLGAGNVSGDWRRFYVETPGAAGFIKFFGPYVYQDGFSHDDEEKATEFYLTYIKKQIQYEGAENIAAIFVECIVGGNGVILPSEGYLEGVRKICDDNGILMICDEVMSGFYRTGKAFAWQNYNIKPDMFTFAKGVNSAYVPLGGVVLSEKVAEYFNDHVFQCGITYSGHTLACAAGVATLSYLEKNKIGEHVLEVGKVLAKRLDELVEKYDIVGEARHIGLFAAIELVKDKEKRIPLVEYGKPNTIMPTIIKELKKKGFATYGRENNIQICPPLIITEEEINKYMDILDEVINWANQQKWEE